MILPSHHPLKGFYPQVLSSPGCPGHVCRPRVESRGVPGLLVIDAATLLSSGVPQLPRFCSLLEALSGCRSASGPPTREFTFLGAESWCSLLWGLHPLGVASVKPVLCILPAASRGPEAQVPAATPPTDMASLLSLISVPRIHPKFSSQSLRFRT